MGKLPSYTVVYQFTWIFGVISACLNPVCYTPAELMCNWAKLCNNYGDCYSATNSLTIDPQMGRSFKDCPQEFDNYKGYCLRVDLEIKSWQEAFEDSENGELAEFYRKQDVKISAEYLRMKLPDSNNEVWISKKAEETRRSWLDWYGQNTRISFYSWRQNETCLALRPSNYTSWREANCGTENYSLRIAYFVTGNNFMCQCQPGYGGVTCDSKHSRMTVQYDMKDPMDLECPRNNSIIIEFAFYKYIPVTNSHNIPECAAPNALELLRYLCQGKNVCRLVPSVLKSYLSLSCNESESILTIHHSCISKNETICPSDTIQIEDENSTNCAFVTHQHASWSESMKFCQTQGGQLAAFTNTNDLVRLSSYTGNFKATKSFWVYGELSDTMRPEHSRPAECTKAIIDSEAKPIHVQIIKDCSGYLTGICVFPPFHQNGTMKYSAALQPTPESTTRVMDETTTTAKYCSAQSYGGLTWPPAIHGGTVEHPCPAGQTGSATWACEESGTFNPSGPDFSQCTTSVSKDIADLSNDLANGTHPDVVVTRLAVTIDMAETIASRDIVNAVDLLDTAFIVQQQIMGNMTNEEKEETMNTFTVGVVNTTGAVLDMNHLTSWFGLNATERASTATKLLVDVDSTATLYGSTFTTATQIIFTYNETIKLIIETRNSADYSELKLPNIIIPSEAFGWANKSESQLIPIVITKYSTIGHFMPIGDHFLNLTNVTQVVGASFNKTIQIDDENVTVIIEKPFDASQLNQSICAFWKESQSEWSTDGCELGVGTNDTHFVCHCNHMTSFAVLMSFKPEQVNNMALNVITIIGCLISIICLAAFIIAFALVRSLRNFCYKVHLHLCISLMIADIILITAHFYKTYHAEDDVYCTALAMLLHYFYLATFMWICLEAVQIYIALVRVFSRRKHRTYLYYFIGYGIPGLVVGISAGMKIEGYGSATHCFLDIESGLIWGFVAFVMATLIFNTVLLFLSLRSATMTNYTRRMKQTDLTDSVKQWLYQIIILHPLLGLTWIFGLLQFGDQLVFSYIFTILNSLQGMFIFVFHVFRNRKVREYFMKKAAFCRTNDTKSTYVVQNQALSSSGQTKESELDYIAPNEIKLLHYRTTVEEYSGGHVAE